MTLQVRLACKVKIGWLTTYFPYLLFPSEAWIREKTYQQFCSVMQFMKNGSWYVCNPLCIFYLFHPHPHPHPPSVFSIFQKTSSSIILTIIEWIGEKELTNSLLFTIHYNTDKQLFFIKTSSQELWYNFIVSTNISKSDHNYILWKKISSVFHIPIISYETK